MKQFILVNKTTRQIVWEGTLEEAKAITLNPWLTESNWASFASMTGNVVYAKI